MYSPTTMLMHAFESKSERAVRLFIYFVLFYRQKTKPTNELALCAIR